METMSDPWPFQSTASGKQLTELTLLYQFSNTLLSTIHINKLTHLILTALTSEQLSLFGRAMLFLRNEKTGVLQGMLGIQREHAVGLTVIGGEGSLSSRWDIGDDVLGHQRSTEFCRQVRSTRIDISNDCPVIKSVIINHELCLIEDAGCRECPTCGFIKHLGVISFAAAPLVASGRSLGIIIVDNPRTDQPITHEDIHFLQLFANQAGMAIENSMLYNRIENTSSSLRDARERLIHGERLAAIGEMAANLAHELKNPLITIGGFAGRLTKTLPADSREHTYADTIVKEVVRLEKMLADILAFSRKPTICYCDCDLGEILRECLDSCAATMEDQGITLDADLGAGPWPLLGDAHQLKQVFLNLLLNACEAMPGGGTVSVQVETEAGGGRRVRVLLADTGGGIPDELLPQVFNPFFTTKRHGTGLGLAIVNRIILNHSGGITAANSDSGALFIITLPLAASAV